MRPLILLLLLCSLTCDGVYMVKKTMCASGCDYGLDWLDLHDALDIARTYQDASPSQCVPYILEISGTITVIGTVGFYHKACREFITIKGANNGSFSTDGRVASNAALPGVLKIYGPAFAFLIFDDTKSWRLQDLIIASGPAIDGPEGPSKTVLSASWSGGVQSMVISGAPGFTYNNYIAVRGFSPEQWNLGNTQVYGFPIDNMDGTWTVQVANSVNPGTLVTPGSLQLLFANVTNFIFWGDAGQGDPNKMPVGLEIIRCRVESSGYGETAFFLGAHGDNVTVQDSIMKGATAPGNDSYAIGVLGNQITFRNDYISGGAEDFISGGTFLPAGWISRNHKFIGNNTTKETWQDWVDGTGVPTGLPCHQGKIYHNNSTNLDYTCNGGGTWDLQSNLNNYNVGYFPKQLIKNHLEWKEGNGIRVYGNSIGPCYAHATQVCAAVQLEQVTQPTPGPCTDKYPCINIAQPWTVISDVAVMGNKMPDGYAIWQTGGAYFSWAANTQTRWSINGNGTAVVTSNSGAFTAGMGAGTGSNVLVDGLTYAVQQPVSGTSITLCDPLYGYNYPGYPCGTVTVSSGLHTLVLPSYDYGMNNLIFRHNLATTVSDEKTYCQSTSGNYCNAYVGKSNGGARGALLFEPGMFNFLAENNTQATSLFSSPSGLVEGLGTYRTGSYSQFIIRNNIMPIGATGSMGVEEALGAAGNGCGLWNMLYLYGGTPILSKNIFYSEAPTGQTWQSFTTGSVGPACASTALSTIWPTDHVGGIPWNYDAGTSPTGVLNPSTYAVQNATYLNWGSNGRAPGADVGYVNQMTSTAISGAYNPALDMWIRSMLPSLTQGLTIYATAYDTSACTWELSLDPNAYTAPVAVSSQTRIGRDIKAVWNSGTLTASKAYYARMTCGSAVTEFTVDGQRAMTITAQ